jgi:hypothetical protein
MAALFLAPVRYANGADADCDPAKSPTATVPPASPVQLSADDRLNIQEVINSYSWAVETPPIFTLAPPTATNPRPQPVLASDPYPFFNTLFTDTVKFRFCDLEGNATKLADGLLAIMPRPPGSVNFKDLVAAQFTELTDNTYQSKSGHAINARHFITNIVLTSGDNDQAAAKAHLVVVLQRADTVQPELDYTATIVAQLTRDAGIWKISTLTVFSDVPDYHGKAR